MSKSCKRVVLDTNILLERPNVLEEYDEVIICSSVLEELDGLKKSSDEVGFKAREALREIDRCKDKIKFVIKDVYDNIPDIWDKDKRDNKIIMTAFEEKALLLSNDLNVRLKAQAMGVDSIALDSSNINNDYKGWKEVELTQQELADFYSGKLSNEWDLHINEYLLIKQGNEIVDKYKWTKDGFKPIVKKSMKSLMFGNLKPKDPYQEIAIDSLLSEQITVITGKAGSGKSLLSLMYGMWAIQNGKYDSIVVMFNPCPVRNASNLGFYKGNFEEKALASGIGNVLITKFGDRVMVDTLLAQGKIKLVSMADCRGMEIRDNEILYITEAQNTNIDLMKICLSRISSGAKTIIEGDAYTQVDSSTYIGKNNGLLRLIDVFKGEDLFSCTELMKIQRSRIAEIADKM